MPRRRPGSPWLRGAVACTLALAVSACGDNPVRIDSPGLDAAERATCDALVDDLPDELFDQERRLVAPAATRGAAWGDPPIVLVCGVGEPEEYDEFSLCIEANGVGWFVPPSQEEDGVDVTITTVGHLAAHRRDHPRRVPPQRARVGDGQPVVRRRGAPRARRALPVGVGRSGRVTPMTSWRDTHPRTSRTTSTGCWTPSSRWRSRPSRSGARCSPSVPRSTPTGG